MEAQPEKEQESMESKEVDQTESPIAQEGVNVDSTTPKENVDSTTPKEETDTKPEGEVEQNGTISAEEYKLEGNKAYQSKDYKTAIESYSKAIKMEPSNPIYLSNRAAAYVQTHDYRKLNAHIWNTF